MQRIILAALAFAIAFCGGAAIGQTNPGFNPNTQWGTTWGMIPFRGASVWQGLAPGTSGQVLVSGGVGANPYWQTITGTGTVTSISGSGGTTGLTLTGGPITGAGTLTLGGTLATVNGGTGLGSFAIGDLLYASSTTALATRTIGSTGNILTVSGGVPTWSAFALSNLPTQPSMTVLANVTGGAAVPTTPTVTNLLDNAFGSSQGMILYRGAAGWAALPVGNNGEFLRTNGASNNPQWQAVSGALGGTVTNVASGAGLTGGPITATGTLQIDAGNIPGVATNSNAAAGKVGEYLTNTTYAFGGELAMASGVDYNIASLSLTAGDWDVEGIGYLQLANTATSQYSYCSLSPTSSTQSITSGLIGFVGPYASIGVRVSQALPRARVSLASTTTYYMVCLQSFSGTPQTLGSGTLTARRIR